MLIVADTGPIITLVQIDQLKTLELLFPDYVLPDIVFEELRKYQPIQKSQKQLSGLKGHIRKSNQPYPQVDGLDEGELACVALYYEMKADAILIEDKTARQWAESQGIPCLGSIAILIKAKRVGLIKKIKPLLLEMRKNKRFVSDELFTRTLKDEGELND